jgi:hypothetical protein
MINLVQLEPLMLFYFFLLWIWMHMLVLAEKFYPVFFKECLMSKPIIHRKSSLVALTATIQIIVLYCSGINPWRLILIWRCSYIWVGHWKAILGVTLVKIWWSFFLGNPFFVRVIILCSTPYPCKLNLWNFHYAFNFSVIRWVVLMISPAQRTPHHRIYCRHI